MPDLQARLPVLDPKERAEIEKMSNAMLRTEPTQRISAGEVVRMLRAAQI
jgi:hypothetical protein